LTILYRSTDRLCRRGAPVKNLAHSASLQLLDKTAPSKFGIKQLGRLGSVRSWSLAVRKECVAKCVHSFPGRFGVP
jgi:hypothetical protein